MPDLSQRFPRASDSVRRLNPGLFGQPIAAPVQTEVPKKRLRQRTDKRSELEIRFGQHLGSLHPNSTIHEQFPLRIGNGSNYYLDFLVVAHDHPAEGFYFFGYEVKGPYARSTGIVKLKAAAALHKWINFELVSESSRGAWDFERVLP